MNMVLKMLLLANDDEIKNDSKIFHKKIKNSKSYFDIASTT